MGVEKIINKMQRQPNGIRFNETAKVLNVYGYELVTEEGSHRHFRNKKATL